MRRSTLLASAFAATLAAAVAVPLAASATATGGERPPECVKVKVVYYDASSTQHTWYWRFCGSSYDSPLRDAVNGKTITVDAGQPGPGSVFFGP